MRQIDALNIKLKFIQIPMVFRSFGNWFDDNFLKQNDFWDVYDLTKTNIYNEDKLPAKNLNAQALTLTTSRHYIQGTRIPLFISILLNEHMWELFVCVKKTMKCGLAAHPYIIMQQMNP